ncbi:MAG TPA: YigZ family protein [Acholeplasmatales bacterium]|nr:YigZ family protein [Acholeplasmatales bacterium]
MMHTIKKAVIFEQIINKSRFIGQLFPVASVLEAKDKLEEVRKRYADATHNCYGYVIGENGSEGKQSDDGEPSGTAGAVIFGILKKNGLTNVLAVVTRYFGGIKLGAGGLVRAYGSSVSLAINQAEPSEIRSMIALELEFAYPHLNSVQKCLEKHQEISHDFGETVKMAYLIPETESAEIRQSLVDATRNEIKITLNSK